MIGLDISDRSIKIVELTDDPEPRLRTVCWSPLNVQLMRRGVVQDTAALVSVLQQARQKCSPGPLTGARVVASIPERQSFMRVVELPEMDDTDVDEAVQWAVRQHIPFDLSRMYLDWQPLAISRTPGMRQVLVGAAPREVVDPLLTVIDELEWEVAALELEAQAIVRSLLPSDTDGVANVLLVDLGATSTNVIFFDRGAMRFTTSVRQGGDTLTQDLVEQLHLQPSIAAEKKALVGVSANTQEAEVATILRASTMKLVRRIEQVVTEMIVQFSDVSGIRAILLAGGTANLPGIAEVFGEVFPGVPVQMGNPWINLVVEEEDGQSSPLSAADAAHFTTAMGLALRRNFNVT